MPPESAFSQPPSSASSPAEPQPGVGGDAGAGPALALLSRGLELWVRQQCQSVERLEIQLEGSIGQLLRGRLEGVRLTARRVSFQQLELERVELRSGPIQVRMGRLWRSRNVELEAGFKLCGCVAFSGEGLNRSFAGPAWSPLADQLAETIVGFGPLAGLTIEEDHLLLQALPAGGGDPVQGRASLAINTEGLLLRRLDGASSLQLPMDPAICIETVELGGGVLQLSGHAQVTP
ncbi:MAG: DUF2993 domain-containing protein [Synechococcaceae cyanobacterium]|nr:DUF2993 domain-containing protein [Synechococcaceae cyanobacterium]